MNDNDLTTQPTNIQRLAISALVAVSALNLIAAANTIAQTSIAPPLAVFPAIFADIGLAAFSIPLLCWRTPAGYFGALAVGMLSLAWPFVVLAGLVGQMREPVALSPVGIVTYLGLSLTLVVTSVLARRAHAATDGHRGTGGVARGGDRPPLLAKLAR